MEKDNAPSTSRCKFALLDKHQGIWTLEIRSRDNGVGTVRLGELILRGSLNGVLSSSIDSPFYKMEDDTDDEQDWMI